MDGKPEKWQVKLLWWAKKLYLMRYEGGGGLKRKRVDWSVSVLDQEWGLLTKIVG